MNIKNRRKNLKGLIILITAVICILLGGSYVSAIYEDIEFYETYKPLVFNIDDSNTLETRRIYDIQNTQIPSSFNLKNKIRIETADQKNLELSNLFASVKSIETNYQLKTGRYIDLSERYIDYMTSNKLLGNRNSGTIYGDNDDSCGDPVRTGEAILLSSIHGIPLESEVPFKNYADNELSEIENAKPACRVISTVQFPKLDTYRYDNRYEEWINIVKAHIMKYGSLQMMVVLDETTMNYSTNAYYCKEGETNTYLDHTVSIIGWDDNYPKENFKIQPYHDGAFIVLNSWGENWGDNGVFYVSYDCTKGFENLMGILNTEDCVSESEYTYAESIYDNGDAQIQVASAEKNCYAVIYNVKSQDEYLKHIGIMTGTNYERCNIKIYCNPYDGELNEEKYVLVGETRNMYRNWDNAIIDLEEPLKLEGSQFAIILEMEYYENDFLYNVASVTRYLHELISGHFYNSSDLSSNWEQLGYDIPLFVYTVNNGVRKIEVTKRPNSTVYYEHETFDPTGIEVKVTYMDGTTKTVTENDIEVTNGANLKRGQTTVSISYTENGVTKTVQIPRIVVVKVIGNTTWQNDYEYTIEQDSVITLNKYIGEDTQITVPNEAVIDDKVYTVKLKEIESDEEESIWGSTNVESIVFEEGIILPNNLTGMFKDCLHLINLDVHAFDTKDVYLMENMFAGCENLIKLDLSSFNTANVESMYSMFYGCKSLNDLNITSFNTSKVTNMESMFENCECLESLDLRHFNTSKVDDMGSMFCECKSLRNLSINNFNTDSLAYTGYMFKGCINLRDLDLSSFNTSNVASMEYMFTGCENLNSIDISNFSFDSIEEYTDMFKSDYFLKIIIVSKNIPQNIQIELPFNDFYELKANGSYGGVAYNKLPTELQEITTIKRYSEEAVSLNEIIVTKNPTKMEYVEGEEIDLSGIEVTAEYIGGIPKTITAEELVVVTPGTLEEGQEEVRISYTENGVTRYATITGLIVTKEPIQDNLLNKISIIKNPSKMEYVEGEEIDLTGIEVKVEYRNGTQKTITKERIQVVTPGTLEEGQEEVRISYTENGVTRYATITGLTVTGATVQNKVLDNISIIKNPSKMEYVEGEEIDLTGIEVKVEYTNGTQKTITAEELVVATPGLLEEGQEEVRISYTENGITKYATITGLIVREETVQNKALDNIRIIKNPNKMGYQEGEEIDLAGIEVKVEYTNGTPRIITEERIQVATPGTLEEGQEEVRISYTENEITKYATVTGLTVTRGKELYRISVTVNPSKMEYVEGEEIDLAGIEVKAEYTSGNPKLLNEEQIELVTEGLLEEGQKEVRISYTENGVTKYATITGLIVRKETVQNKVLDNINIIKNPNKMGYKEGEEINLSGIEVKAEYTNGTPRIITEEIIQVETPGTLSEGQKEVRISYTENGVTKYATITGLTVTREKELYRISIINNPSKMEYLEGEEIDLSGIEVKAEYTSGEPKVVAKEQIRVESTGALTAGQEEVRISYTENGVTKYATITGLTVSKETLAGRVLSNISIIKNPNKMGYLAGETVDLTGIEVRVEYTNDNPRTVTAEKIAIASTGTLVAGQEEVRISYTENGVTKYATITGLTVTGGTAQEKVLYRISIIKNPSKMGYLEGETINLSGIEVKAEYTNGNSAVLGAGQISIATPGALVAGQEEVRISYTENGVTKYATVTGLTVTKEITPQEKILYRISIIKNPNKMEYKEGETISLAGIEVKAEYTSGNPITLNATQVEVVTAGTLVAGQEEVRISYTENGVTKYATITGLTVTKETTQEKVLNKISITKNPSKMGYLEGEEIDLSGIEVKAEYTNGNPTVLGAGQLVVATPGTLVAGQQEVRISYTENGVTKYATITGLTVTQVRTLYRISITKNPTKMEYVEGEEIDLSGIEVKAEYTSGSSVTLNASQVEVATPGALMEGQEEIRIRYKENGVTKYATITGLTVTQEVTIEKTLYRIDIIKNPTKMEYKEGETINLSGIEVRAEYINGSPRTITSEQLEVVTPGTLVAGQEEVRISYTEDGVTKYATITGLTVTKETIGGQDLSVAFKTYSPVTKNGIVYVKGIVPETSFRDVEDDITTNGDKIELYKGTEKITNKDTKITTGMILTISLNSQEKSYTLVVIGDLTGDGKLNGKDLLKLARYKAGLDKNLTGAYLEAADIHMDNECAGNKDLLKMARIMAHKDSL